MKKVLLTTAAALAISSSAFADFGDKFYLRGDLNLAKFNTVKLGSAKYKTKFNTFGIDVGAGTYVADNMRAELVYNHVFGTDFKYKDGDYSAKLKPNAQALMLRGMFDFGDFGFAKPFAGLGLGWSKVSAKASDDDESAKFKSKNNLAWSAHLGMGFGVAEGVTADLGYSYRNYGKSKNLVDFNGDKTPYKVTLKSHNLSAGVRFDI